MMIKRLFAGLFVSGLVFVAAGCAASDVEDAQGQGEDESGEEAAASQSAALSAGFVCTRLTSTTLCPLKLTYKYRCKPITSGCGTAFTTACQSNRGNSYTLNYC
jgi:hypothetical protein